MSSIIDDENTEYVNNDPDPSEVGQPNRRVRRGTVLAVFMVLGVMGGLAIFGLLAVNANAQTQRGMAEQTQRSPLQHHAGTDAGGMYDTNGQTTRDLQTAKRAATNQVVTTEPTMTPDDGTGGGNPEPTATPYPVDPPTTDPLVAEAQYEEAARRRAVFDQEQAARAQHIQDTHDAIAGDMRVGLVQDGAQQGAIVSAGGTGDTVAPTPAPSPTAAGASRAVTKTSGACKLVAGRDFIDGDLVPNVNGEAAGIVSIYVTHNIKDASGALTCIPRGSYVEGIPGGVAAGQQRLTLRAPLLVLPDPASTEIDLSAVAADSDGTNGIGAHVDDHRRQVLTIAAVGGALSSLATLLQPATIASGGINVTTPSASQQVLSGSGASVLQSAGNLAQAQMTRPPTLTAPHGKRVILYLEQDLYLDPYCDPQLPNSPECIVKGQLNQ
jgi:type IV secretion system protein VirB10